MKKPLVSVVIPCYNYGRYLPEAVESVESQTFQDFEIIIINDGSTDDSQKVAEGLVAKYNQDGMLLITQKNKGLAAARNIGIERARGEYILPLDADDKLHPEVLEKMVKVLEENPKIGLVYSWVQCFGDSDELIKSREYNFNILKRPTSFINCSSLFRKKAWEVTGGYNPKMKWGWEDLEFWINCGKHRFYGKLIPQPLVYWRRHEKAMTITTTRKHLGALVAQIKLLHPELYPEFRRGAVEEKLTKDEPYLVVKGEKHSERKILLVMPGHGISTSDVGRGYGEALAKLGWDVLDYELHERLQFYRESAKERLEEVKDDKEAIEKIEMAIFHAAVAEIPLGVLQELPDVILYITGQFIPKFPLELIKKRFRIPQAVILTESPYLAEIEMRLALFYDLVFTNDRICVEEYKAINSNVYYLPTAYAESIYPCKEKIEDDFQSDLFFVGSPVPGRAEFINQICGKLKGIDFKLFGAFTKEFGLAEDVFDFWEGPNLKQGQVAKYLAGTKIGFNFFRVNDEEKGLGLKPYSLNPRVYEVMASGALLLTDYRPELEDLFEIGKDLVVFNGPEDLAEKVRYYLEHEKERKDMAQRGQAKVLRKHSYANRAEQLLKVVRKFKESEVIIDGKLQNR